MSEAEPGLKELPKRGVYTLVIRVEAPMEFRAGRLGKTRLEPGFYLYTGSGLGKGALGLRGRVKRHLGARKRTFWHIDYLLGQPQASVAAVVASPSLNKEECRVNRALMGALRAEAPVKGFGSSDCRSGCPAHLLYVGLDDPTGRVAAAYAGLGLRPVVLRLRRELEQGSG